MIGFTKVRLATDALHVEVRKRRVSCRCRKCRERFAATFTTALVGFHRAWISLYGGRIVNIPILAMTEPREK